MANLLGALQAALTNFAKSFLLVAFVPVVCFAAVNVSILRTVSGDWVDVYLTPIKSDGFGAVLAVVILSAVACVLVSVQPWLLQLLEGEHLPEWLGRAMRGRQVDRLDALKKRAELAHEANAALDDATYDGWMLSLENLGKTAGAPSPAALATIDDLWAARRSGEVITAGQITEVVLELQSGWTGGAPAPVAAPSPSPSAQALRRLVRIAAYARDRSRYGYLTTQNFLQFNFPGDVFDIEPSSDNILAPTAFGNIGRTMRSYALRRYSMDLDIFWTRLQKAMADSQNSKMFDALQTQKTQLDFIVTLFWLTLLTGALWLPWLAAQREHPSLFRAMMLGVPATAWVLYHAACRAYVLFADQVRTAVDFFRFEVLRGLHIAQPPGTLEETVIWERLGGRIGYANTGDTFIYDRRQQ